MRKIPIGLFTVAFLIATASSVIIITQTTPKVFQVAEGQTMIVLGQDLEDSEIAQKYQQAKQTQSSQQEQEPSSIPTPTNTLRSQPSKLTADSDPVTSTTGTNTRIETTMTYHSSYSVKTTVHHVRMFSSFGSLGHRKDQEQYRNLVHKKNMKWIEQQKKNTRLTFSMKENQFSILTVDQFKQYYLNLIVPSFVPKFEFDLNKEIRKFINDDDFINRFFNSDFGFNRNQDFFSFNKDFKNKEQNKPIPQKKEFIPVSPSDSNLRPDNSNLPPSSQPINPNIVPSDKSSNTITPEPIPIPVPLPTPIPQPILPKNDSSSNNISPSPSNSSTSTLPSSEQSSNLPQTIVPSTVVLDIDWVRQGYVTSIKDQGSCGGCYSFAAQGAIESAFLINNADLYRNIDLSQQQIIDCSNFEGNNGCNGGWMPLSFNYAIKYGTTTQSAYPYAEAASKCKISGGNFKISSYKGGSLSNCSALSVMVAGRPISVAVSAGNQYWQNYAGGIMNQCGSGSIDHGVMLVGVYQDAKQNYWKVKNSWGTSWGQNGYVRLDRSVSNGNICSICSYGFYPVL